MTDDKTILAALERCRTHIELIGEHLKRLGAAVDLIAAPLPANPRCFMPGDRVRFINDQTFENCRFIVDYANEEWVYVSMEVAPVLKHRAKPEQLRLISPP